MEPLNSRAFFFDLYGKSEGKSFIRILEIRNREKGYEQQEFIVFEEDLENFTKLFYKSLSDFRKLRQEHKEKAYSIDKIREVHKNAYAIWTPEDDNNLEILFCEGKKIKELAKIFGRNNGAITSRIKKLELKEKYGL